MPINRISEVAEQISKKSPDKGYRRSRDDLDRFHRVRICDKKALRLCRSRDIKSTIKYANNDFPMNAANLQYLTENVLNRIFHTKLEIAGMTQSMSSVARCIDNVPMEGFWGILAPMEKHRKFYIAA